MNDQSAAQAISTGATEPLKATQAALEPFSGTISRTIWLLVACSPIIFALVTWPIAGFTAQDVIRHYSLPIVTVEIATVLLAFTAGFQPRQVLAAAPSWIKVALTVLAAVAIGTALFVAPDEPAAVLRTSTSIFHVLFALSLVYLFAADWRAVAPIVWPSIVIGTLGYVVLLVPFVASITDPKAFDWVYFQLGVTHVRQTGFYSVVGACAAFGLALSSGHKGARRTWLIILSILLAMSFWSGTRSSLVAFTAACLVGLRIFPILRTIRAARALLFSMTLGLAISLLHQVPHPAFGALRLWAASGSGDPGSGRMEIWLGAIRVWLERPLFGYGESQFRLLVPEVNGALNHPHNWILQILFQWGLVGAICYFALATFIWFRFENAVRKLGAAALPAYLTAVSLLVYSLYEGTLYHPYPIAMLAVAVTWVLAAGSVPAQDEPPRPIPPRF